MSMEFETDHMTAEEIEEIEDAMITAIAEDVERDESRTSIINTDRMQDVNRVISMLRPIAKYSHAKLSYKLNKPFQSMGSVSITGPSIEFLSTNVFYKAVKLASSFEVYPKTDGTICATFTFHRLTIPAK